MVIRSSDDWMFRISKMNYMDELVEFQSFF